MSPVPHASHRAAGVAALAVFLLVLAGCGGGGETPRPTVPRTPPPTTAPTLTMPPTSAPPTSADAEPSGFRYQPLWPFADAAAAEEWRRGGGSQPWHADAGETALSFAAALGFDELDQVTSQEEDGDEAWVGVGYRSTEGTGTAAVLHLARFGDADDSPWEVVGTRDDTLTLDTPDYGGTVGSTITAGGTVTGVDESLRVQVRSAAAQASLGESCCLPAGGEDMPWEVGVTHSGARGTVLTVVVSTGGHVADVERFAITGVRVG